MLSLDLFAVPALRLLTRRCQVLRTRSRMCWIGRRVYSSVRGPRQYLRRRDEDGRSVERSRRFQHGLVTLLLDMWRCEKEKKSK